MINSKTSAPIVALMIAATMPETEIDAELRKQPAADEGADDADDEVADETEACALDDLSGQPSGNNADYQNNCESFTRHVHLPTSSI